MFWIFDFARIANVVIPATAVISANAGATGKTVTLDQINESV